MSPRLGLVTVCAIGVAVAGIRTLITGPLSPRGLTIAWAVFYIAAGGYALVVIIGALAPRPRIGPHRSLDEHNKARRRLQ